MPSKLIEWKNISEYADRGELRYRQEIEAYPEPEKQITAWINEGHFITLFNYFKAKSGIKFSGKIADLGAGSCWLSSKLSKIPEVKKVYAVEFSKRRLTLHAPIAMKYLQANEEKIIRIVGDFNKCEFPDSFLDFIVVDAALHHAKNINYFLNECNRILKKEGRIIAFRERVYPLWRKSLANQKLPSNEFGSFEHIYSRNEYLNFFRNNGFEIKAIPGLHGITLKDRIKRFLKFLNGYLFADFIFIGIKK